MKLSAMGVTILAASGDDGAPGRQARSDPALCGYDPFFPSSLPYVLSVGATMGPESGNPEVACNAAKGGVITSGGGFSSLMPAMDYQKEAIATYLQGAGADAVPGFNTEGRGLPDLSVAGSKYLMVSGGNNLAASGTSASTPVVAAMIALVNSERIRMGKGTVGWIHPALYSSASLFVNDITMGNNSCTETSCCPQGFTASVGWDPVTGLGSINFAKFFNYFTSI